MVDMLLFLGGFALFFIGMIFLFLWTFGVPTRYLLFGVLLMATGLSITFLTNANTEMNSNIKNSAILYLIDGNNMTCDDVLLTETYIYCYIENKTLTFPLFQVKVIEWG